MLGVRIKCFYIKYVFRSSLQTLFEIFYPSTDNLGDLLEVGAEMFVNFHVKYPLLQSDFKKF
jgi:hypothetical protein